MRTLAQLKGMDVTLRNLIDCTTEPRRSEYGEMRRRLQREIAMVERQVLGLRSWLWLVALCYAALCVG